MLGWWGGWSGDVAPAEQCGAHEQDSGTPPTLGITRTVRHRPSGHLLSRPYMPQGLSAVPQRPTRPGPAGSQHKSDWPRASRPSARRLHRVPARGASAAPRWARNPQPRHRWQRGAMLAPRQTGRQRPAAQPRRARRPALGTDGQGRQARRRPGRRGPGSGSGPQPFRRRSARLIRAATMPGSRGAMMSSAASRSRPARTVRSDSPGWRTSVATDGNAAVPSGPRGWPSRRARTCTR